MLPETLNRFGYVRNNPVVFKDPSGNVAVVDDVVIVTAGVTIAAAVISSPAGQRAIRDIGREIAETVNDLAQKVSQSVEDLSRICTTFFAKPTKNKEGEDDAEKPEHKKNARPSTKQKHEEGRSRAGRDAPGGEKGDERRPYRQK